MAREYTNQTLFNKVVRHLLKQGKRSEREKGNCRYRGPNGLRCAIGACITNKQYHKEMEGLGTKRLQEDYGLFPKVDSDLLARLQWVHDRESPDSWASALYNLAREHNLKLPKEL